MKKKSKAWLAALPLHTVTIGLVLIPLIYILALSFMQRDVLWGVAGGFTLENYAKIFDPVYLKTFRDSLTLAGLTTLITLLLGYPFGYFMARLPKRWRGRVLMLVIVPFWTNALVRIYGWIILLRSQGPFAGLLVSLGLFDQPPKLLYTYGAVLLGMVYSLLPFMILPSYTSVEKLDWSLVEASRDLGASRAQAFFTVTLKLTLPGILSGCVLVFVPSVGLFFIADLLGGGKIMLLGNLIKNQLLVARDWPFGAALSVVMMGMTCVILYLYRRVAGGGQLEGLV